MGESKIEKNWLLISGFNIESSNRGTAALGYGSITFLKEKGFLGNDNELAILRVLSDCKTRRGYVEKTKINIQGGNYAFNKIYISFVEYLLAMKFGVFLPFGILYKCLNKIGLIAAVNGGDGFSDIYGTKKFQNCIIDCKLSVLKDIPLVILPQTLGPFKEKENYNWAKKILRHAQKIYVRDEKFVDGLNEMSVAYELSKDLSAYMHPEKINIEIKENAVGINVSGLAYSNNYRDLSGQFDSYPVLIDGLINHFRDKGCPVYLIPHSYNYDKPDFADDDMEACKMAFDKLKDKAGVYFIDKNLISPQIKYVISKMSFFIGTRMHANFAAIYTNTPVFGLAYSYKFAGAFNANGLSDKQTYLITNLPENSIGQVIEAIDTVYNQLVKN